jgi:hypothetical protein
MKKIDKIAMYDIVYNRLHDAIMKHYDYMITETSDLLWELETTHGTDSIISMWGYLVSCKAKHLPSVNTWPAIYRDLQKRSDPEVKLLTSGYKLVTESWFEIEIIK